MKSSTTDNEFKPALERFFDAINEAQARVELRISELEQLLHGSLRKAFEEKLLLKHARWRELSSPVQADWFRSTIGDCDLACALQVVIS